MPRQLMGQCISTVGLQLGILDLQLLRVRANVALPCFLLGCIFSMSRCSQTQTHLRGHAQLETHPAFVCAKLYSHLERFPAFTCVHREAQQQYAMATWEQPPTGSPSRNHRPQKTLMRLRGMLLRPATPSCLHPTSPGSCSSLPRAASGSLRGVR